MGLTEEQKQAIRERAAKRKNNDVNEVSQKGIVTEEQSVIQNQNVSYNVPKMYCKYCGNIIDADSIVCSYCGNRVAMSQAVASMGQVTYQQNVVSEQMVQSETRKQQEADNNANKVSNEKKPDPFLKLIGYFLGLSVLVLVLQMAMTGRFPPSGQKENAQKESTSVENEKRGETEQNKENVEKDESHENQDNQMVDNSTDDNEVNKQTENIEKVVVSNSGDLSLGDIGEYKDDVLACLSYVKRSNEEPTALGNLSDVPEGNEIILGYFEFYNQNDEIVSIRPGDITCYADNVQVTGYKTYIKVESDGIRSLSYEDLEPGLKAYSVQDFQVPIGWQELKFYLSNGCIWTIHNEDVSEMPFDKRQVFPHSEKENIKNGGNPYKSRVLAVLLYRFVACLSLKSTNRY